MSTTTTTAPATVLANIQDPDDTKNVYYQSGGYRLLRPVLIGAQVKRTFDAIPTVDVSNIFSPDLNVRKAIAAEVGFFYASNPPVSKDKMGRAPPAARRQQPGRQGLPAIYFPRRPPLTDEELTFDLVTQPLATIEKQYAKE